MNHKLMFRDGTWDADIWRTVAQGDEYRLGDFRFNPYRNGIVIDVGAHIGAFTFDVLSRGATRVVAVEADEENLYYLRHNVYMALGAVDRVVIVGGAVSGSRCPLVDFPRLPHPNTGGRAVTRHEGLDVDPDRRAAVHFPVLIDLASPGGSVELVKLDCEGSEWSILDGLFIYSGVARRVNNWVGEYHLASPAARGRDAADLVEMFGRLGFVAEVEPTGDGIGLFRAWASNREGFPNGR